MNTETKEPGTGIIEYAVDYGTLDPVKQIFQKLGAETSVPTIPGLEINELAGCRGESVHIVRVGDMHIGSLIEGLGTRGLVADEIYRITGVSHYQAIAWSAAMTIFNDLAQSGIPPVTCFMYLSAGSNKVFADTKKMLDLGLGWKKACIAEHTVWGGGETPMLRDLVFPGAFEIAGSTWGIMPYPKCPIDSRNIRVGDRIIGIASSGVHDNGLTLVRDIRSVKLTELGYQALLSDGQTFGQALMEPTVIYGPLVRLLLHNGTEIHSALNITGHGLAKIARAVAPFHYEVENLPEPQPVFRFIQEHSGLSDPVMYNKFNMGTGFVLIVPEDEGLDVIGAATMLGHRAWLAGSVKASPDGKKRVLLPNGMTFTEKDVAVR